MAKPRTESTFEDMLAARLRWALESTIIHFLGRPDRNTIEDWSEALAVDMAGERTAWQRPAAPGGARVGRVDVQARSNHKVEATST